MYPFFVSCFLSSVYMFNCSLNIRRLDITITISYGSTGTSFTYNSGMEGEIVGWRPIKKLFSSNGTSSSYKSKVECEIRSMDTKPLGLITIYLIPWLSFTHISTWGSQQGIDLPIMSFYLIYINSFYDYIYLFVYLIDSRLRSHHPQFWTYCLVGFTSIIHTSWKFCFTKSEGLACRYWFVTTLGDFFRSLAYSFFGSVYVWIWLT